MMKIKCFLCTAVMTMLYYCAAAESVRCSTKEKEVYSKYGHLVDSVMNFRTDEEIIRLNNAYNIPPSSRAKMEHYVRNMEFRLVCQELLYKDSLVIRMRNKSVIEEAYRDSINTLLIPAYGNNISGENVSMALRWSEALRLDSAQYSHIMNKALDMARRIRKDYRVNLWNEEMEVLKNTLDKKQLRSFFTNKNAARVTNDFNKAWARLKEAGLTEQLDSTEDANDAVNYLFSKYMIKDIYRYYGTPQKKNLAELDKKKPKIITLLAGLDRKAAAEERRKTIGKEFIW